MQRVTISTERIRFHEIHGRNVVLSRNRTMAERMWNSCFGTTFSDRPVKPCEPIFVKILKVDREDFSRKNMSFGFTSRNPDSWTSNMALPPKVNNSEYWSTCPLNFNSDGDSNLFFYYTMDGMVHYGIDDTLVGSFFLQVAAYNRLWMIIDLYGKRSRIAFVNRHANWQPIARNADNFPAPVRANVSAFLSSPGRDRACTVCFGKPVNTVVYKCGHLCLCHLCAKRLLQEKQRCPICRAKIEDVVRVFYS